MQSGVLQLGSLLPSAAWALAKGEGPRAHLEAINFNPPFPEPPIVLTFLAGFRASNETDLRVSVEPVNITANNFFVKIGTWRDSLVQGCDVSWIAVSASGASLAGQRVIASRQAFKCKDLPSWRLDKGKGDRTFKQAIQFHPADSFTQVPLVFMGFSLLDIVNEDDYRLNLATGSVEKTGLELHLSTWSETHVWSTHVSWLALDESYMRTQEVQVAVGRIPFKKTLAGYKLHEGSGYRHVHAPMMFPKKFSHTPSVVPALTLIDLLRDTPPRVRLHTAAVSALNGTMELNATEKGHVWGASCAWLAHAPADKADAGGKKAKIQPAPSTDAAAPAAAAPAAAAPVPAAAAPVPAAAAPVPAAATPASAPMSPASSKKEKEDEDEATCKVCYDAKINTVILFCGHMALCFECSKLVKGPGKKNECPICKAKIKDIIKTYST